MPLKYPTTSRTLLEKISSGDEISWDEFYSRYAPVIQALAKYREIPESDVEDICQQVMIQFFKQSRSFRFDPDLARFRTYFGRIINAKIIDYFRERRVQTPDHSEPGIADPGIEQLFIGEWRKVVLKDAEQKLKNRVSPETYQAYELYAVQERPVEKVAAYLDCSVNQVYQAKKRFFAIMKEILLEMNNEDPELQLELSKYGV